MNDNRNDLGKVIKRLRLMIPLTLKELATKSSVSASHLGRIERGERFPSASILRKLAEPLDLRETDLLTTADYLSPQAPTAEGKPAGRLDSYVAMVLSQEPIEVQRTVISILSILKSISKEMTNLSS